MVDKDGDIVTNAHVVTSGGHLNGGGTPQEAKQVFVEFGDRNRVSAEIVGFDADADVALIKVDPDGLDLEPVTLSDRSSFAVGEPVAAIGSPFGEDQSLSIGVISATDRTVEGLTNFGDRQRDPDRRLDQPGQLGRPAARLQGPGDRHQRADRLELGQQLRRRVRHPGDLGSLLAGSASQDDGKVEYAFLGVTSESLYPQLAEHLGLDTKSGALITDVVNGSPADDAGLKGSTGETPSSCSG